MTARCLRRCQCPSARASQRRAEAFGQSREQHAEAATASRWRSQSGVRNATPARRDHGQRQVAGQIRRRQSTSLGVVQVQPACIGASSIV